MGIRVPPELEKKILEQAGLQPASIMTAAGEVGDEHSEKEFQGHVIALAKANGWRVYHTHDSRKSEEGFPDLLMLRAGRMVVAELKVGKNKLTAAQQNWLEALHEVASEAKFVKVCVWRPENWPVIREVLQ